MTTKESKQQINELIEAWQLNEAELNQTDIDAMRYLLKENKELEETLRTYQDPEDLTLMFLYCEEKSKDKIKELNQKYLNAVADYETTMSENQELNKKLDYIRGGEYYNQLRFERDMLQNVVDNGEVSKEDKQFIDMTHRNTELLEQQQEFINFLEEKYKEMQDIWYIKILQKYKEIIGDDK